MNPKPVHRRALVAIPAVVVTALAAVGLTSLPAWADTTVSDLAQLSAALGDVATAGPVIALGADISAATDAVHIEAGDEVTLDLNGNDLTLRELILDAGSDLTLTDTSAGTPGVLSVESGTDWHGGIRTTNADLTIAGSIVVHATGGGGTAGIGGGDEPFMNAGDVTITDDAVVVATGGNQAAGIGGGQSGNSGTLVIDGNAEVTATGGTSAAGIGGAGGRNGGIVTIGGSAVVVAEGTATGAGIGGGNHGSMGTVTISGDADVTAHGGASGASGIGGGDLGDGGTLTVSDTATVSATGHGGSPGIGAAEGGIGGSTLIEDSAVVGAAGGPFGAGISTGGVDDLGTITISDDATVTASGGDYGAGLGGNAGDPGGTITIGGGSSGLVTVTATGGMYGSGIGGGWIGDGGTVSIGTNSTVTAAGGANVIGAGLSRTAFGTLDIDGQLEIPAATTLKMAVSTATITGDGYITGAGSIQNGGSIQLPPDHVMVAGVTGNNHLVTLALGGGALTPPATSVRVYATSFAAAGQALPAPTRSGYSLTGWKKGTAAFSAASVISAPTTITAQWVAFSGTIPAPTVTGIAKVGETLTAGTAGWPAGTTFDFRWLRAGKVIAGETASSYELKPLDYLKQVSAQVIGTAPGQPPVTKTSALTAKVTAAALASDTPGVTGTFQVGELLTADPGIWSPAPTFSYQWYIDGAAVAGATGATWKISGAAAGKLISVRVTGSTLGYTTVARLGLGSTPVEMGTFQISTGPSLTGTAQTGMRITAVPGAWSPVPSFTFQWFRDGEPIIGATASTYLIPANAQNATFQARVVAALPGYESVPALSPSTALTLGSFIAPTPKISGTVKVGRVLTAVAGTWTPVPSLSYQWLRISGSTTTVIPSATGSTYLLTAADKGKTIRVRITGVAGGFGTLVKTSAATVKVI